MHLERAQPEWMVGGGSANVNSYNMGTVLSTAYADYGVLTNAPIWLNVIDSQGTLYVNGITKSGSLSEPGANISWQALGNDASGNAFMGYLKYLLISTNHALTATEITNLYVWSMTNGVTNVSGGCVAWSK